MRGILKSLGIVALAIYLTQQLIPTIMITNINTFIILSGLIFLVNFIVGPLTKILFFLPNNLLILNLTQILGNFLVLFLLAESFPDFQIQGFNYLGNTSFDTSIQAFSLTVIQTTILAAILISIISSFLTWLTD